MYKNTMYRVYVDKNGIVYSVNEIHPDERVSKPREHTGGWNGTFNYAPKIGIVISLINGGQTTHE